MMSDRLKQKFQIEESLCLQSFLASAHRFKDFVKVTFHSSDEDGKKTPLPRHW